MLYIPPGFGHGFLTLQDNTHFLYKCTEEYAPEVEGGVKWDDPNLVVKWPLEDGQIPMMSHKDISLPYLEDIL